MTNTPSRRTFLQAAAVTGASAALTLAPLHFADATPIPTKGTRTATISGHLEPGAADWVYLPIEVPSGVAEIAVSYRYSKPAVPSGTLGNSCDIGIFDQRGTRLNSRGFRGWSGGFRTEFTIAADAATPGYLPGPVRRGTWHVILGPYQVSPQGLDYSVTVTLTFGPDRAPAFAPRYPPQSIRGTGPGWYRGDNHLHTVYSDGRRTPDQVAAGARTAGLDFISTTDHNTSSSHPVWGPLSGDDLLIITGEEVTTRNGHVLALGLPPGQWVDWRYRAVDDDFDAVARMVRHAGGIVVPAHPYCPYVGCRWKFGYASADAIEVWNGPWTLDDELSVETWDAQMVSAAHGRGGWLPAMGNSDAHSEPQVIGLPQTVVYADRLSRDALLAGIAGGRSYLAESRSVVLAMTAASGRRSAGIGEYLGASAAAAVTVTVQISGVPNATVRLITDEGQILQTWLTSSGTGTITWTTTPQNSAYVRAEVRHPLPDGTPGSGTSIDTVPTLGPMAAMTNPVWLGRAT
ncbi:hypothetical protein ABIB25_001652 [Nakamurella sp. UYEF19]|uniref:CehA/McbA family metallohydrolase n=1 Tax=Nakamurella sp. UYEF19 TaxID=1756392 RepID=UPI0033983C67